MRGPNHRPRAVRSRTIRRHNETRLGRASTVDALTANGTHRLAGSLNQVVAVPANIVGHPFPKTKSACSGGSLSPKRRHLVQDELIQSRLHAQLEGEFEAGLAFDLH